MEIPETVRNAVATNELSVEGANILGVSNGQTLKIYFDAKALELWGIGSTRRINLVSVTKVDDQYRLNFDYDPFGMRALDADGSVVWRASLNTNGRYILRNLPKFDKQMPQAVVADATGFSILMPKKLRFTEHGRIKSKQQDRKQQAPDATISLDALRTAVRTINAAKAQFGDTLVLDLSENKLTALMCVE